MTVPGRIGTTTVPPTGATSGVGSVLAPAIISGFSCSAFLHSFASWRLYLESSSIPLEGMPIHTSPKFVFS
jgi:hypothetical protein